MAVYFYQDRYKKSVHWESSYTCEVLPEAIRYSKEYSMMLLVVLEGVFKVDNVSDR